MVLENDRTITLQLREMLTIFEKDIFVNSLLELRSLQDRIRLTTWYLIALGALALIVIGIFLVLILKDITKSQHYRLKLEQAKAYSDSLLKSKEQFMLSITHDIKSPIASVTGYARLMQETDNQLKKKKYLENINKSADHILKLISDLVDLTRIETGKLKIENATFRLSSLIDDIYSEFYPLAESKNLDFSVQIQIPEESFYISDPLRLKQVLGNIISNAIKYTDTGNVKFIITRDETNGNIQTLNFNILDTGIGISQQDGKVIFNEFTRIRNDNGKQYEGVGLGLSISKKIIQLLHGSLSFTSTPGKGSHFTISLPLEKTSPPLTEPVEKSPVDSDFRMKTIIIIDDDLTFLQMTAEIIQNAGMQVYMCNSAIHAIHLMEELTPDLIITDIQMPNMNGLDLLAYIQRKTGYCIPVIAVTGQESPDIEGVKLSACLKKPFLPEDLLHQIGLALHTKRPENVKRLSQRNAQYGYSLNQIRQFVRDDTESLNKILISFVETSHEHVSLFDKYIIHNDRKSLSELAHKMLAMFRQLEARTLVNPLAVLENAPVSVMSDEEWADLGKQTAARIEEFLDVFCLEQGILI
jgi:signal transduction histidine kinase/DNA-binding response OmpR family regulator